ncbi:MAG: ABC transporter ATP-binding protein [Ilumatobacteraceae bacterium]
MEAVVDKQLDHGVEPVISARQLTKVFDDQEAISDLDLSVDAGVIVGVIGPSGCGKTTLVRMLTGIARPTSGEVRVFGADPTKFETHHRRRFGYMPQLPVLYPNLTVWGNLNFIASVYGISAWGRREHLEKLLDLVDLGPHRHKRLADCSGGMQRRLTLAATLVHRPELLYLDEPTAGVDPILRDRFWTHFRSLREQGATLMIPTQYVGEAVSCDLVAVMSAGRLITVQPPDSLGRFAYGGDLVSVGVENDWISRADLVRLREAPYVREASRSDEGLAVVVDDEATDINHLQQFFAASEIAITEISPAEPSFDAMFVRIIEANTDPETLAAA